MFIIVWFPLVRRSLNKQTIYPNYILLIEWLELLSFVILTHKIWSKAEWDHDKLFIHEYGHSRLFRPWMWPRKFLLFMNLGKESYFAHESDHGKFFCSWIWPRQIILFMNMVTASYLIHECGHRHFYCSWIWPRTIILFMNVTTANYFVHDYGHGKLFCSRMWLRQIILFINMATADFLFMIMATAKFVPINITTESHE
jgi:hypothetical protein